MSSLRTNLGAGAATNTLGSQSASLGTLNTIPSPRTSPPVYTLASIGTDPGDTLVFHAAGDSGGTNERVEEDVSAAMAADFNAGQRPAFLLHLGDVVYGENKDQGYLDRFYRAYSSYPGPIVAIPGNHDGEIKAGTDPTTLRAFWANFCAPAPGPPANVDQTGITRQTMALPGVYWHMQANLADIIGLYSNTGESGGTLQDGHGDTQQTAFLADRLAAIAEARKAGSRRALIVATHHPPFSSSGHSGSALMLGQIDQACAAAGIYPDLVLSGHAHNYQQYRRSFSFNGQAIQVPFVVAGTLGYGLQAVAQPTGGTTNEPGGASVTYEHAEEAYGYLVVEVGAGSITVTMRTVSNTGVASDFNTLSVPFLP